MEREAKKLSSFTQPFPGAVNEPETQDKRRHCARALDAPLAGLPSFLCLVKDDRPLERPLGRKQKAVRFRSTHALEPTPRTKPV